MPTNDVTMGARYKHDKTGVEMRVYAASVPDLDDSVRLIEPMKYPHKGPIYGFAKVWYGDWEQFENEWTRIEVE